MHSNNNSGKPSFLKLIGQKSSNNGQSLTLNMLSSLILNFPEIPGKGQKFLKNDSMIISWEFPDREKSGKHH